MLNYKIANTNSNSLIAHIDVNDIMSSLLDTYFLKDVLEYPYHSQYRDMYICYIKNIEKATAELDSIVIHVDIAWITKKCKEYCIPMHQALYIYTSLSHLFLSAAESLKVKVHLQVK